LVRSLAGVLAQGQEPAAQEHVLDGIFHDFRFGFMLGGIIERLPPALQYFSGTNC
jgi:hypothetical protein